MNRLALDAALTLCLGAGAADLAALNLVVLPAARDLEQQRLGLELSQRTLNAGSAAPARRSPAPRARAEASRPEPVAILEFEPGSPRVNQRAAKALAEAQLQLRGVRQIVVIGHADASGPELLNDRLSVRRADAVARYLRASGIAPERVRVDARGEREPREGGNSRRVEIFAERTP